MESPKLSGKCLTWKLIDVREETQAGKEKDICSLQISLYSECQSWQLTSKLLQQAGTSFALVLSAPSVTIETV